jgi:hypothetical protein
LIWLDVERSRGHAQSFDEGYSEHTRLRLSGGPATETKNSTTITPSITPLTSQPELRSAEEIAWKSRFWQPSIQLPAREVITPTPLPRVSHIDPVLCNDKDILYWDKYFCSPYFELAYWKSIDDQEQDLYPYEDQGEELEDAGLEPAWESAEPIPEINLNIVSKPKHFILTTCNTCGANISDGLLSSNARFCEYTGDFYCSECHKNREAIIPARVVHEWDFRP